MSNRNDYLTNEEQLRLAELVKSKGLGWVASELRVPPGDVEDAARGDDVDRDLVDDVRRLLARM